MRQAKVNNSKTLPFYADKSSFARPVDYGFLRKHGHGKGWMWVCI